MVIPVSKLMSKTHEDENVSILSRVFQVIVVKPLLTDPLCMRKAPVRGHLPYLLD